MRKVELPIQEIVEKYEDGVNIENIAKEYRVSCRNIYNRLKEYYERPEEKKSYKRDLKNIKLPIEEIVKKYENGINIENIAKECGASCYAIDSILQKYYKQNGKRVPRVLKSRKIIEGYLKRGITMEEIRKIALRKDVVISQDIIDGYLKDKYIIDREER